MQFRTPASEDPNVPFQEVLRSFLTQVGYTSENTQRGVKSAVKDYTAVFKEEPPHWINSLWPSIALSVLHLAVAKRETLPHAFGIPESALKKNL